MPELPEVETIVRQLKKLVGKRIVKLEILDSQVVKNNVQEGLDRKITDVSRRGKSILIHLDNETFLSIHLRMTGHFHYVQNNDQTYKKYLACIFYFDNNHFLTHNSIRRFGTVSLLTKDKLDAEFKNLGIEPLSDDFTSIYFIKLMKKYPASPIKNKLLDQHLIAGIGNIYAQEALYHAGIHPERKIGDISNHKLTLLYQSIKKILLLAIENNGTTVQNYANIDGKGNFQNLLAVYNQKYCPKKHLLKKIKQAGRGTYYCPKCQT